MFDFTPKAVLFATDSPTIVAIYIYGLKVINVFNTAGQWVQNTVTQKPKTISWYNTQMVVPEMQLNQLNKTYKYAYIG